MGSPPPTPQVLQQGEYTHSLHIRQNGGGMLPNATQAPDCFGAHSCQSKYVIFPAENGLGKTPENSSLFLILYNI